MQLDFKDLNAWWFTDYKPALSPFRFGDNSFLLFIVTDAFWVALYAMALGYTGLLRLGLLLPLLPAVVIAISAGSYTVAGPLFTYGFSRNHQVRGNEIVMVHISNTYDEQIFKDWLLGASIVSRPWETANAENTAVWFTHSMQAIKWGDISDTSNVIGTICMYEEDKSITIYPDYIDCFAGRVTFSEKLNESFVTTNTGFGREVDRWYSMAKLCEGVEVTDEYISDIELNNFCRGHKQNYPKLEEEILTQYGVNSDQINFIKTKAYLLGL